MIDIERVKSIKGKLSGFIDHHDVAEPTIEEFLIIIDELIAIRELKGEQSTPAEHSDDFHFDLFASCCKEKLAAARNKGRSGWDHPEVCSVEHLAELLVHHLTKGNTGTFEDIANFAMMLHQRSADPKVLVSAARSLRFTQAEKDAVERALNAQPSKELKGDQVPVYQMRLLDGSELQNEWVEVSEAEYNTPIKNPDEWDRRVLFTAPQKPVVPVGFLFAANCTGAVIYSISDAAIEGAQLIGKIYGDAAIEAAGGIVKKDGE
jgi:hypothetical protein